MDPTTYLGPNPQVFRKVPILNPVHRSRASHLPWLPGRSTKLAVGALTALPLETGPVQALLTTRGGIRGWILGGYQRASYDLMAGRTVDIS